MHKASIFKFTLFGAAGASLLVAAALAFSSGDTHAADPASPPEAATKTSEAVASYLAPLSLSSPITFSDCVAPATDCCNPSCKNVISGCCVANTCGLPVQTVITGKLAFTGLSLRCSDITSTVILDEGTAPTGAN